MQNKKAFSFIEIIISISIIVLLTVIGISYKQ
ncbi:prepilin-type N-terminal cleavage/methylation domain-containing protein [bacterium]|nr:prepilin-type N-terminal cleavage/methylation domain-containing protein [bacterium]